MRQNIFTGQVFCKFLASDSPLHGNTDWSEVATSALCIGFSHHLNPLWSLFSLSEFFRQSFSWLFSNKASKTIISFEIPKNYPKRDRSKMPKGTNSLDFYRYSRLALLSSESTEWTSTIMTVPFVQCLRLEYRQTRLTSVLQLHREPKRSNVPEGANSFGLFRFSEIFARKLPVRISDHRIE